MTGTLRDGGTGPRAYGEAIGVYLALGIDRLADRSSTICGWDVGYAKIRNTFGRQAIPMVWDFAEGNVFSRSTGNFESLLEWIVEFLGSAVSVVDGSCSQKDASSQNLTYEKLVSTDPPYYDNIGYADLSDFFYVWLRRSLRSTFPDLFTTVAVPKTGELVATPYRHGSKGKSRSLLHGRYDSSDGAVGTTGTFRLPGYHLLCLQAVRNQGRCRHVQHRLGDFP